MKLKGGYEKGEKEVVIMFQLENTLNNPVELAFPSGQQYEIYIINDEGEEVYRFSEDQFFTMVVTMKQLKPGASLNWKQVWNCTNKDGEKLLKGDYKLYIELKAESDDIAVGEVLESNSELMLEFSL